MRRDNGMVHGEAANSRLLAAVTPVCTLYTLTQLYDHI